MSRAFVLWENWHFCVLLGVAVLLAGFAWWFLEKGNLVAISMMMVGGPLMLVALFLGALSMFREGR